MSVRVQGLDPLPSTASFKSCVAENMLIHKLHACLPAHPASPASVRPARPAARRLPPHRRHVATNLARAEGVAQAEVDVLLAQPDFQELLAALAEMEELTPEERLRQLERMAWHVLEMALADGDWRAAAFVADQMRRGCHPARSLGPGRPDRPGLRAAVRRRHVWMLLQAAGRLSVSRNLFGRA